MPKEHLRVYRPLDPSNAERVCGKLKPLEETNQAAFFKVKSAKNIGVTIVEGHSYSPLRDREAATSGFPESAGRSHLATVTGVALMGLRRHHRAVVLMLGNPEDPSQPDPALTTEAELIAKRLNKQLKKENQKKLKGSPEEQAGIILAKPVIPHITVGYANARLSPGVLQEKFLPIVEGWKIQLGRVATNPAVDIRFKQPPRPKRAPREHPHAAPQVTLEDLSHVRPGSIPLGLIQALEEARQAAT